MNKMTKYVLFFSIQLTLQMHDFFYTSIKHTTNCHQHRKHKIANL